MSDCEGCTMKEAGRCLECASTAECPNPTPTGGTKNDLEKTRLDLIPSEAIELIGRAFTHGAKEYGDHNYRKGIKYSRLYAATCRHLNAYWGGEDIDEPSGLPHLALAGAEICMLATMDAEHDDRYKGEPT